MLIPARSGGLNHGIFRAAGLLSLTNISLWYAHLWLMAVVPIGYLPDPSFRGCWSPIVERVNANARGPVICERDAAVDPFIECVGNAFPARLADLDVMPTVVLMASHIWVIWWAFRIIRASIARRASPKN